MPWDPALHPACLRSAPHGTRTYPIALPAHCQHVIYLLEALKNLAASVGEAEQTRAPMQSTLNVGCRAHSREDYDKTPHLHSAMQICRQAPLLATQIAVYTSQLRRWNRDSCT